MRIFRVGKDSRGIGPRGSRKTQRTSSKPVRLGWRRELQDRVKRLWHRLSCAHANNDWTVQLERRVPWNYVFGYTQGVYGLAVHGDRSGASQSSAESTSSFEPEDPRTRMGSITKLLTKLVGAEGTRRKILSQIQEARSKLKECQRKIDQGLAATSHLSKRSDVWDVQQTFDTAGPKNAGGLYAEQQMLIQQQSAKTERLIEDISRLEEDLTDAMTTLVNGESTLFRATSGFLIRHQDRDEDEEVTPRRIRHLLRTAAEYGRSPLRRRRVPNGLAYPESVGQIAIAGMGTRTVLNPDLEASIREENFREFMTTVYSAVEALIIKYGKLQPADTCPSRTIPGVLTSDSLAEKTTVLEELKVARREYAEAVVDLCTKLPQTYVRDRENFVMTYRNGFGPDPTGDARVNSPEDFFDREYMHRQVKATNRVRTAGLAVYEARNRALEHKVADPEEPQLFGVLDHPDDGFTESEGTAWRESDEREAAHAGPRIRHWIQQRAVGRGPRAVEPSDIADLPGGSQTSARYAFSAIEPVVDRGVLKRWTAECVVTRAEADAEYLRFQGQPHATVRELFARRP